MNRPDDSAATGQDSDARPARRRWWPVLAPVVVIAVAVSLLFPAARHQWALSFVRQPTRFTALSFNYAWTLPSIATSGRRIPVSFTIANREGRTLNYRYVVRETDLVGSRKLLAASRPVASGRDWTVATSVLPQCSVYPCTIAVLLPGHAETLDFVLTTVKAAPQKHKHEHRSHSRRRHHSRLK